MTFPTSDTLVGLCVSTPLFTPLAQSLENVRGHICLDGMIHRSTRMTPIDAPSTGATGDGHAAHVEVCVRVRGPWDLITAITTIHADEVALSIGASWIRVEHVFARWNDVQTEPPVGPLRSVVRDHDGASSVPDPAITVSVADIRAWADAINDHNPIHLTAAAAHAAGLPVADNDVIVHGSFLACLAWACAHSTISRSMTPPAIDSLAGGIYIRYLRPVATGSKRTARLVWIPGQGLCEQTSGDSVVRIMRK